nr:hypothetical protein [Tanacetum cinerariifolium]
MVQSGGTVETSSAPNEETRAHQETVYRNLVDRVAQVNMVNCNMRATNAELKSELARYKIQEQSIEISQEKYDKLKSVIKIQNAGVQIGEEAKIQLQAKEFDFMAAAGDLDEIEEVNANCILMANLQHASTSGTQLDKAPVYNTDGSAEVQLNDNCYDNEIFNMFTQEEQYTDLLEPIPEPQLVPQNDNHVTYVAASMVQSGGTVETSSAPNEETRAHQKIVYRNLIDQVAHVNMVNCNMRETNVELKSELARYTIQEQRIEISQEKYEKLEKCYQKSVYQDSEDRFLDKEVDLEAKIKDLENILLKMDQTVQTMHMLNPKPNSFYHPDQKMALGYPNPSYLKKAQLKQQSLYNGNLMLEEHDPPVVYDSEETLELAQESREKIRFLKKEIKPANYAKIKHLPGDDTTPSVAREFLNEVKNSFVTLQRVVKQKMTLEVQNWSSSAHKEVHKIISHEIAPIINQVDAMVQNFEIQFLQEAAKFVRDFKSLAKEDDESIDKQKSLELEIKRLLKASVSHDIMSIVQNGFVNVPSDLQTNLDQYKYDKISYDKAYNDMQQKVEWLQAQLRDLKGTSITPQVDKPKLIVVPPYFKKLHVSIPSHSVPQPREFNIVKHSNVIAPEMFKIDPPYTSRVDMVPNKQSCASIRTNPITNFQRHVTFKENVSSDMVNASSIGLVNTARTRRPQPKGNARNARVPSASKSSKVKKM